jgi:hypothetical protein
MLIERYGQDKNMVDLRLELAEGCPKIAARKVMTLCGAFVETAQREGPRPPNASLLRPLPSTRPRWSALHEMRVR